MVKNANNLKAASLMGKIALSLLVLIGWRVNALQVHVTVATDGTNFNYRVFNDEPTGGSSFVNAFHLVVNAPFVVKSSPVGWNYVSDNFSYIDWFNANALIALTNDIAPASSKAGFSIQSLLPVELPYSSENLNFALSSWNHIATNSETSATGSVIAPSITTTDPWLAHLSISNHIFQGKLLGIPSYKYTLEVSTNFFNWNSQITNISPFAFYGSNVNIIPCRFYRANYVPTISTFAPD